MIDGGIGTPDVADARAIATPRSPAGSVTLHTSDCGRVDVLVEELEIGAMLEHGDQYGESTVVHALCRSTGHRALVSLTSACTSTSRVRRPSVMGTTQRTSQLGAAVTEKQFGRVIERHQACPRASRTDPARPSDRSGAFAPAAGAARGVDRPRRTAPCRRRAPVPAGPASVALFGDVADQHVATPDALAAAPARARDSRTCVIEPGDEPSSGSNTVWIESTTRRSGCTCGHGTEDRRQRGFGHDPELRRRRAPRRPARSCTCCGDSSAETRQTCGDRPRRATRGVCSVSVDLPMPGSPPSR